MNESFPAGSIGHLPSLTVVTVTLGPGVALERTAESLRNQHNGDFDWLVVNGGGPIPSAITCGVGNNATVLDQPPRGIYPAMNLGLSRAATKSVSFLNAGDSYVRSATHTLRWISSAGVWGYGALRLVDPASGRSRLYGPRPFRPTLFRLGLRFVPHPSAVVRRSDLLDVGGFPDMETFRVAGDQMTFMKLMKLARPIVTGTLIASHILDGVSANRNPAEVTADFRLMRQALGAPILRSNVADRCATRVATTLRTLASQTRKRDGNPT